MTVIATLWMILAVTGFGFFSGGTTSLALSLVLLYGTGAALIVVICAVYRLVNRSAVKRSESAPKDTAAVAFVDTARSATEELLAALRPPAATGRPQNAPASPRTVRPAAAGSAAKGAAGGVSAVPVSKQSAGQSDTLPAKPSAKQSLTVAKQGSTPKPAAKTAPAKGAVKPAPKASAKSALNKSVRNKAVPNKAVPTKAIPNNAAQSKAVPNNAAQSKAVPNNAAQSKAVPNKAAAQSKAAKASQAKGRPANNNGSKSTPAKRTGGSADRMSAKKQPSAKDSGPGPVAVGPAVSAQQPACGSPAKSSRPALVLASSNTVPQPSRLHIPDSRKRAS